MHKNTAFAHRLFGKWLTAAREREEITRLDAAYLVGVCHQTFYNWERGYSFPQTLLFLKRLECIFRNTSLAIKGITCHKKVLPNVDETRRAIQWAEQLRSRRIHKLKGSKPDVYTHRSKQSDKYCQAFGKYLRKARIKRKLCRRALAYIVGLKCDNTIHNWEAGYAFPRNIVVLGLLNAIFGNTLDIMFNLCPKNGIDLSKSEKRDMDKKIDEIRRGIHTHRWHKHHQTFFRGQELSKAKNQ